MKDSYIYGYVCICICIYIYICRSNILYIEYMFRYIESELYKYILCKYIYINKQINILYLWTV